MTPWCHPPRFEDQKPSLPQCRKHCLVWPWSVSADDALEHPPCCACFYLWVQIRLTDAVNPADVGIEWIHVCHRRQTATTKCTAQTCVDRASSPNTNQTRLSFFYGGLCRFFCFMRLCSARRKQAQNPSKKLQRICCQETANFMLMGP